MYSAKDVLKYVQKKLADMPLEKDRDQRTHYQTELLQEMEHDIKESIQRQKEHWHNLTKDLRG